MNIFMHEGSPKMCPELDFENCQQLSAMSSICSMLQMLTPAQKDSQCLDNCGRVIVLSLLMEYVCFICKL